jgi:hypothetical protein
MGQIPIVLLTGCAYQFSNLSSRPPSGVQNISIEAVYDTSQRSLPHELVWEGIQRAFAENGRLRLTSVANADAYVQTQIFEAGSTQGTPVGTSKVQEPKYDENIPVVPGLYQKLTQAQVLADTESQMIKVDVKIWHLRTKKLLFSKIYGLSGSYRILDNGTTRENKFLRADEAFRNQFGKLAQSLGASVVNDFLSSQ